MLLRGPNEEEVTFEVPNFETLKVRELIDKLPQDIRDMDLLFVSEGCILNPSKTLKDYNISESSIINYLIRPEMNEEEMIKEKARCSLPSNPTEVVKSFRVLLDQLDLPFGEKLKEIVYNEESFASILAAVPGMYRHKNLY